MAGTVFDLTILENLLLEVEKNSQPSKKKYLHLKSIRNFLIHFNSIKDAGKRKIIYDSLYEYLLLLQDELIIDEINIKKSKDLFTKYIYSFSAVYEIRSGFIVFPDPYFVAFMLLILIGLFFAIGFSYIWYIGQAALAGVYLIRFIKKQKERKVYGFCY